MLNRILLVVAAALLAWQSPRDLRACLAPQTSEGDTAPQGAAATILPADLLLAGAARRSDQPTSPAKAHPAPPPFGDCSEE